MRFLHTSDWQLGKPFGRVPESARAALQEARLDAINRLANAARTHGAHVILVAGDVFDSSEPGDRIYRQALSRMRAASDLRWVLLPGNHDPARADGLWSRLKSEAPANVIAALDPVVFDLGDGLHVLPAPLAFKRTTEDPTDWFDRAETPPGARRVGLAHGSVQDFSSGQDVSNPIAPDRAKRSGLDYLALGDWHGRKQIDARTAYSGTPEPDDFGRETTGEALIVTLGAPGEAPTLTPVRTGDHHWIQETWTLSTAGDVESRLEAVKTAHDLKRLVARIALSGVLTLAERVTARERLGDGLAHEIRWLDLREKDLLARPTDDDLAEIDVNGVLRDAAERLRVLAAEPGPEARHATAALERLYVEHQRAVRAGSARV